MNKWYDSVTFLSASLPVVGAAVLEPKALVIVFCIYGVGIFLDCGADCIQEVWKNGRRR